MTDDSASTGTSIDEDNTENNFESNPARDILTEGFLRLFKPIFDALDDHIGKTRVTQIQAKQQLDEIFEKAKSIENTPLNNCDFDRYSRSLSKIKTKVTVILNILQNVQARLNNIHLQIEQQNLAAQPIAEESADPDREAIED